MSSNKASGEPPDTPGDPSQGPDRSPPLPLSQLMDSAAADNGRAGTVLDPDVGDEVGGRYQLLEPIGEGGFGTVYRARQIHPVRREVALKLIKLGMDTRAVIARFEAERQALALMDHPNVAKVHDAGSTRQGRPFFVMELVAGEPITTYCQKNDLSTRQRLELFIQVCNAVGHAHTKGIIHRDIKPSNVLVTVHDGRPVPKVIDFGIAKATSARLTERTLFTEQRQFIGTPEYMSPEQARMGGVDVDTRTDIYSLGVLLYELLTGVTPFEARRLRKAGYDELQRIIREEDPPRPSTRVSSAGRALSPEASRTGEGFPDAIRGGVSPAHLSRELRGDLDWIVMRAIEKDRSRRYESASAFAADIGRHLNDEPVLACPPSVQYRFGKFARRHTRALAAAAAVALALILGMTTTVVGFVRAQQEAHRAKEAEQDALDQSAAARRAEADAIAARDESEEVTSFLVQMLTAADPSALGREVTVREVVDIAARDLPSRFTSRRLVEARLNDAIGRTYLSLGHLKEAESHLTLAIDTRQELRGPSHEDTIASMMELAGVYHSAERFGEGQALVEKILERAGESLGPEHALTLRAIDTLGAMHRGQGHYEKAEQYFREAVKRMTAALGPEAPETLNAMHNLAFVLQTQGRLEESLPLSLEAAQVRKRVLGPSHPETLLSELNYGVLLGRMGRSGEALAIISNVLETYKSVLGEEHPRTNIAASNLAALYYRLKDLPRSLELRNWQLEVLTRRHGPDSLEVMEVLQSLAAIDRDEGRFSDAEVRMRRVLETRRAKLGPEDDETLIAMNNLAGILVGQERWDEALALIEEALAIRSRIFGDAHPESLRLLRNLALMYRAQKRYEESASRYVRLVAAQRKLYGPGDPRTLESVVGAAAVLNAVQDYEQAEALALDAYEHYRARGESEARTAAVASLLVRIYEAWEKPEEARAWRARVPASQPASAAFQR